MRWILYLCLILIFCNPVFAGSRKVKTIEQTFRNSNIRTIEHSCSGNTLIRPRVKTIEQSLSSTLSYPRVKRIGQGNDIKKLLSPSNIRRIGSSRDWKTLKRPEVITIEETFKDPFKKDVFKGRTRECFIKRCGN